jgi:PAS domain S-box-containing protein
MADMDRLADPALIIDNLGAFIYTKDRLGSYVFANAPVQELFGSGLAEIAGKDDSAFFDLERSNDLRVNDEEVMSDGVEVSRREVDIVAETGERRVFWTIKRPILDDAGTVIGMSGISFQIPDE